MECAGQGVLQRLQRPYHFGSADADATATRCDFREEPEGHREDRGFEADCPNGEEAAADRPPTHTHPGQLHPAGAARLSRQVQAGVIVMSKPKTNGGTEVAPLNAAQP